MEVLLLTLEGSVLARAMRESVWLYPVANVLHVLGALGFFAAVAAMDAKALRATAGLDVRAFVGRIRPFAVVFLALQLLSGSLLFLPEASHIGHNAVFLTKLAAIAIALLNVVLLETALARVPAGAAPSGTVRFAAAASLLLWLTVAAFGRLIAYF
jgi:hypothetical protein